MELGGAYRLEGVFKVITCEAIRKVLGPFLRGGGGGDDHSTRQVKMFIWQLEEG